MTVLRTLIGPAALHQRISAGEVLVVDCRFSLADPGQGRREHVQGHIPGAVYAHLDEDLSSPPGGGLGRHPLPADEQFSAALGRWGWQPGRPVIAYDGAGGALAAARLWWLLRLAGGMDVAVLDGGIGAWQAAGLGLERGDVVPAGSNVTVQLDREQVVWTEELERRLREPGTVLLDARAAPRFRGDEEPLDPVAGHVPAARNRPLTDNLDASGRFKPAAVLAAEFHALLAGAAPNDLIHMCGSGVTACHNLLAMEHAGLAGSRIYAPSWSGWCADPAHPVARGEAAV